MHHISTDPEKGTHWVARVCIAAGTCLYRATQVTHHDNPSYQTIQTGRDSHIWEQNLVFLNHSCDPTAFFDAETLSLHAIRDIPAGEEITFFYPSTEWEMDRPFVCTCCSGNCVGTIRGAKYLTGEMLKPYLLNRHIIQSIREHSDSDGTTLPLACSSPPRACAS